MPQPRDDQGVGQCPFMSPVTPFHAGMAPCLSLMARTCLPVCCPLPRRTGAMGQEELLLPLPVVACQFPHLHFARL